MIVRETKVQSMRVDDWVIVNDGDDRSFTAAQIVSRETQHSSDGFVVYRLTLLFAGGKRYTQSHYKDEVINKIVNL